MPIRKLWAVWMHRKGNVHDLAFTNGRGPRLHHIGVWTASSLDILHICDVMATVRLSRQHGARPGPARHLQRVLPLYPRSRRPPRRAVHLGLSHGRSGSRAAALVAAATRSARRLWGHPAPKSWFEEGSAFHRRAGARAGAGGAADRGAVTRQPRLGDFAGAECRDDRPVTQQLARLSPTLFELCRRDTVTLMRLLSFNLVGDDRHLDLDWSPHGLRAAGPCSRCRARSRRLPVRLEGGIKPLNAALPADRGRDRAVRARCGRCARDRRTACGNKAIRPVGLRGRKLLPKWNGQRAVTDDAPAYYRRQFESAGAFLQRSRKRRRSRRHVVGRNRGPSSAPHIALTMLSVIFLASPSSIMVLSR